MVNGRYLFKNTSIETAYDNERFVRVLRSLESAGVEVDLQTEEVGQDLLLTFQKQDGVLPRRKAKPKVHLPMPLSLERCQKELALAIEQKQAMLKPRSTAAPQRYYNPESLQRQRMKQLYVGWWLSMNWKQLGDRKAKLDYTLLEAAGIGYTRAKYPRKRQWSFAEYLRSTVTYKPYSSRACDPLATPVRFADTTLVKADIEYWQEMVRLAAKKTPKRLSAAA